MSILVFAPILWILGSGRCLGLGIGSNHRSATLRVRRVRRFIISKSSQYATPLDFTTLPTSLALLLENNSPVLALSWLALSVIAQIARPLGVDQRLPSARLFG
jgi:hypothetical protein